MCRPSGLPKNWQRYVGGSYGMLCLILLCVVGPKGSAYVAQPTGSAAQTPPVTATPTVTPLPPPVYDPPAPPDLSITAASTSLKIVDPNGYPRIVKLWGGYEHPMGLDFYAQYDLIISNAFSAAQIAELRTRNPYLRMLYSGIGTYDTDDGPIGSQWINATDWRFNCFLRGTAGQVLRVDEWNHGMFNMSDDRCTATLVDYLLEQFDPTSYDGVFFDRIYQQITPYILTGIDLDHNGLVDDQDYVNERYWRGTQRFLAQVRTGLRAALGREPIIVANDAPLPYTDQLNGREYEMFIRDILDNGLDWQSFMYNYEQWMQAGLEPHSTLVMGNPPYWMRVKYGLGPMYKMPSAMVAEAAAYYRRMRFGLTTTLLEGGLYSYEFGDTWHGNPWWYDEFDAAGLGKGYLGQPLGEAYNAFGPLTSTNTVINPSFETRLPMPWSLFTQNAAHATLTVETISNAPDGSAVAHISIINSGATDEVRLAQVNLSLRQGHTYTLSFWGRAPRSHWLLRARLHAPGNLNTLYGLNSTLDLGTTWQRYELSFTATTDTKTAMLSLGVGSGSGEVWLDQIALQEGALPTLFRRDFERGTVLCNASADRHTVSLDGIFRKINGAQAPLRQILIDDRSDTTSNFIKYGGWGVNTARNEDWGSTFNYALTTNDPYGYQSQVVWQPVIDYADRYTVSVWMAPHANCTDTVTYTVRHAEGVTPVAVSQAVSQAGWVTLGTFPFEVGTGGCVTLTNLTQASWVVADVLKFESVARYNDGTLVSEITLDGWDGIILLDGELAEVPRLYLPLVSK